MSSPVITKHKPGGTKRERVAPPVTTNTPASDAELAAALFKIMPEADTWRTIEALAVGFAKYLPGRSAVMLLGRALELGFVQSHSYHHIREGYIRPGFSFVPSRLVGSISDRSPLLLNAEHIAAAAARLQKIVDGLEENDTRRKRIRIGVPAAPAVPVQVVVFTPDARGRYQFHKLEK